MIKKRQNLYNYKALQLANDRQNLKHHLKPSNIKLQNSYKSTSKSIKTQPTQNQNKKFFKNKFNQIKMKYNKQDYNILLNEQNNTNTKKWNNLKIRQVDSPMNCLNSQMLNKTMIKIDNLQNQRYKYIIDKETTTEPRIKSIDKINEKIRNILNEKNISQFQNRNQTFEFKNKLQYLKTSIINFDKQLIDSKRAGSSQSNKFENIRKTSQPKRVQSLWNTGSRQSNIKFKQEQKPIMRNCKSILNSQIKQTSEISRQTENKKKLKESIIIFNNYEQIKALGNNKKQQASKISKPKSNNKQLKQLLKRLKIQIQLDRELRNKKFSLNNIKDSKKIKLFIQQLDLLNCKFNPFTIQSDIIPTQQQYDPFYTSRSEDVQYKNIAVAYKQAIQYWQENIYKKFSYKQFLQQGFNEQSIDIQRKGYIVVEDLVRLMNFQNGCFFRKRDLILVFRRMGNDRIFFKKFIQTICKQDD